LAGVPEVGSVWSTDPDSTIAGTPPRERLSGM
jgi:hypothetical protein